MSNENTNLKEEMSRAMADFLVNEVEKLEEKVALLQKTLRVAGEYARKNPPAEMPKDPNYFDCLIGGPEDPEGLKYIRCWLMEAKELN